MIAVVVVVGAAKSIQAALVAAELVAELDIGAGPYSRSGLDLEMVTSIQFAAVDSD